MEGYPPPGAVLWALGYWLLGLLTGVIVEEWRWRRRYRIEAADRLQAGAKDRRREVAKPLLDALGALAGKLELHAGSKGRPAATLIKHAIALRQHLGCLRPVLAPADADRISSALQHCLTDEACHSDAQHALDTVRELQTLITHTLDS